MLAAHRRLRTWSEKVDSYIALTEFARRKLIGGGLPADKVVVKPNFVDPDPGARKGKGDFALFVGRLSPEKGPRTMIEAWQYVGNHIPLRIVGEGPLRPELEARALQHELLAIQFQGRLSHEQTLATLRGAQFLVFPSQWYEAYPMTIVESFACGLPVICSRLGALEEIVEDRRTGLFFTAGDPEDLAAKVDWAWTHAKQLEVMGREARAEYEAKYTAEKNYPMLMEIYERAIAMHACPRE